jgi:hypothetical protein
LEADADNDEDNDTDTEGGDWRSDELEDDFAGVYDRKACTKGEEGVCCRLLGESSVLPAFLLQSTAIVIFIRRTRLSRRQTSNAASRRSTVV